MPSVVVSAAASPSIRSSAARFRRAVLGGSAWIVFGIALIGYFLRRPGSLTHAEFAYEDGRVFYLGSWFGGPLDGLFRPHAGYLNLIPRSVAVVERQVPPAWAPFVSNLAALVIAALVVRFLASDRLAEVVPDRRLRFAGALLLVILPGMDMVHGSITFIQFYLAVFLIAGAIASPAKTMAGAILFRLALLCTALTGPFSALFAPLYVIRLAIRRDRDSLWSLVAIGIGAAAQLITLMTAVRVDDAEPTLAPIDVMQVVGVHLATGFTGTRIMNELVVIAPPFWPATIAIVGLAALLVVAVRSVPRLWLLLAAYVLLVTIGSTLVVGSDTTAELLDPRSVSRYFVVPWFVVGLLLIVSGTKRNQAGIILLGVLAIGIVGDFRLPTAWNYGWSASAACVGGPAPCEIPVFPGIPRWAFIWPGSDALSGMRAP